MAITAIPDRVDPDGRMGTVALDDFAGFGLAGYRSFGSQEIQRIGPMSKVHLVVGQNDVGKSNLLRFAYSVLSSLRTEPSAPIATFLPDSLDSPLNRTEDTGLSISLCLNRTEAVRSQLRLGNADYPDESLASNAFTRGDPSRIWIDLATRPDAGPASRQPLTLSRRPFESASPRLDVRDMSLSIASQSSSSFDDNLDTILRVWAPWSFIPPMKWVDAVRELTADERGDGTQALRNGRGLIRDLARLQNPSFANRVDSEKKWNALQAFVRDVLDDPTASLSIPMDADTIHVHRRDDHVLPLTHVGTGISEVIFIAAVATGTSDHLICIEEPETHLHPTVQRKLIEYLHTQTDNRYLISTHSASMLNAELASITHLEMADGWTAAAPVLSPDVLAYAVADLGHRASDLVQANFVLWVEGPSDRIYINYWLSLHAPELIEGAHYSVMFYGGALLSHLTVADISMGADFIQLLRINRNLGVVIDSDRASESAELNATKMRILDELDARTSVAWVTDGYTIENYVPYDTMRQAIGLAHPNMEYELPSGQYTSPLGAHFHESQSKPSKVAVAKRVVELGIGWANWPGPMRDKVVDLVACIRSANGLGQ